MQENPRTADVPEGAEVALVRRALLIDADGEIVPSPLVESIQIRYLYERGGMTAFELILDRERLFLHEQGGLVSVGLEAQDFPLFRAHDIDRFQSSASLDAAGAAQGRSPLQSCAGCHVERLAGIIGGASILTISRERFPVPEGESASVLQSSIEEASSQTIAWKRTHPSWNRLWELWGK
ncbi:MAG: hypothetical protein IPJ58_16825 [Ardenticatenia bacterium]|nr:hypothetical protein [Ardenticatenia bacterium]